MLCGKWLLEQCFDQEVEIGLTAIHPCLCRTLGVPSCIMGHNFSTCIMGHNFSTCMTLDSHRMVMIILYTFLTKLTETEFIILIVTGQRMDVYKGNVSLTWSFMDPSVIDLF